MTTQTNNALEAVTEMVKIFAAMRTEEQKILLRHPVAMRDLAHTMMDAERKASRQTQAFLYMAYEAVLKNAPDVVQLENASVGNDAFDQNDPEFNEIVASIKEYCGPKTDEDAIREALLKPPSPEDERSATRIALEPAVRHCVVELIRYMLLKREKLVFDWPIEDVAVFAKEIGLTPDEARKLLEHTVKVLREDVFPYGQMPVYLTVNGDAYSIEKDQSGEVVAHRLPEVPYRISAERLV